MKSPAETLSTDDADGQRSILVGGMPVWYRKRGSGTPLLLLPGWGGPTDKYSALLDELAGKGYSVVMPDLPGLPGKTPPVFMTLEAWGSWVDELAEKVCGRPFILVAHSLSARIALEYLEGGGSACLCAISIGPWLVSSPVKAALSRLLARLIRFLCPVIYPDMKWVLDGNAWKTALRLLSAVGRRPPKPCLVVYGDRDPARRLFGGWKHIGCEAQVFEWGHSPQITATSELADTIDRFVIKNL